MSSSISSTFFRNSGVRTDCGRLLPLGRSVTPIKLIFFSSRSTFVQAQFFPENFLNKRCELQFFSGRKTLISVRSSWLIFLILNKTTKKVSLINVYCRSLDSATLFSKVDSNKLKKIALICAKFSADLVNTSIVTSLKTKWPRFIAHPVDAISSQSDWQPSHVYHRSLLKTNTPL